jgi:hypothetical protein
LWLRGQGGASIAAVLQAKVFGIQADVLQRVAWTGPGETIIKYLWGDQYGASGDVNAATAGLAALTVLGPRRDHTVNGAACWYQPVLMLPLGTFTQCRGERQKAKEGQTPHNLELEEFYNCGQS